MISEVYLEDCVTALKRYKDNHFDLAIVDPPYGIGANKMTLGNGKKKICPKLHPRNGIMVNCNNAPVITHFGDLITMLKSFGLKVRPIPNIITPSP